MIARFAAVILARLAAAGIAAAQTPVSPKPDASARNPHADPLRGGWYPWDPYQYGDYRRGVPVLTRFDVEIERALERILGVEILLPETIGHGPRGTSRHFFICCSPNQRSGGMSAGNLPHRHPG
jgi:hypothetical protein